FFGFIFFRPQTEAAPTSDVRPWISDGRDSDRGGASCKKITRVPDGHSIRSRRRRRGAAFAVAALTVLVGCSDERAAEQGRPDAARPDGAALAARIRACAEDF